jgi:hypothetical protein
MLTRILADIVVVFHFAFVLFVVLGGILSLWWRRIIWVHIPLALWGALVEFTGWICPLTPLEHWLRLQGDGTAYRGEFIEHYILPILYPSGLTREIQLILGAFVVVINLLIYGYVFLIPKGEKKKTKRPF